MSERMRVQRILWAALSASTLMMLGVLVAVRSSQPPPAVEVPILLPVIAAVALVTAVASFVIPKMLLGQALARLQPKIEQQADEREVPMFRAAAPMRRVFAEPDAARKSAAMAQQVHLILGLALSEAIAIQGLMLGLLGFDVLHVLPFFAVAFLLCLARFPTQERMDRALEAAHGAKMS